MIYFYKSISPHNIENLHNYLHYFFTKLFQVKVKKYNPSRLIHPNFKPIVEEYEDKINSKLTRIFIAYQTLTAAEKSKVKRAYKNNNNIIGICNKRVKPIKYDELPVSIKDPIESLYDELWDTVLNYKVVRDVCGTVKSHFNLFRKVNDKSVCPFCGLGSLLCEYDDGRDDYDHYLPKAEYPFISVNFLNLFPMCHNCNSKSKGQKDSPFIPNTNPLIQRSLYFPYDNSIYDHEIILNIKSDVTDLNDDSTWELSIDCKPEKNLEKKNSWLEIFNIEKRYKSKIIKDSYKWKERIMRKYDLRCIQNGSSFNLFKSDILDDYQDYVNIDCGILMKCFDEFILNDPNFENNMKGIL